MDEKAIDDYRASEDLPRYARRAVVAATLFALIVATLYFVKFHGSLASDGGAWGEFGDYIGGLVNPAVGLATVYLVFITISLQRRELQASLRELKKSNESARLQNFEQSFFTWLKNYRDMLNDIREGGEVGRDVLGTWYRDNFGIHVMYKKLPGIASFGEGTRALFEMCEAVEAGSDPTPLHVFFVEVNSAYFKLYKNRRSDLDALYRTLYRLMLWIDNSDFSLQTRWHYMSIVRAQLSWIECVFLLFNGLTREGYKFGPIANKYALFDNLAIGSNAVVHMVARTLLQTHPPGLNGVDGSLHWPYSETAFDSNAARRLLPDVQSLKLRVD